MSRQSHVLVVEDNSTLAYGLKNNLEIEGHRVTVAATAKGAALEAKRGPDLIVLDLMLPDGDGFRLLEELREKDRRTPVLILTARGLEADKVRGLKLGADDYVTKPFGVLELLARVEALLRRASPPSSARPAPRARFGDIEVDPAARIVTRSGVPVILTPKELDLLLALLGADGAAVSRAELMERTWGYQAEVLSRTVDTHIAELRRKLEVNPPQPEHILTVRKTGYRLARVAEGGDVT